MTAKRFLAEAEQHLRIGDIILSRSPTLMSWAIRKATGSTFSHAALVFLVAKPEDGFGNSFVLQSIRSGVGLASLAEYIGGRNPREQVGILRLEGADLDEAYFKRVRGLMLDHVNSGYDFGRVMRMGLATLFGLQLGWSTIRRGTRSSMKDAVMRTRRRTHKWVPPQFICSGFIQYGLAKAADVLGKQSDVMLKQGLMPGDRDGILAVTPEDVASSPRLRWRFAARRGWVHEVSSYEAAKSVISSVR